MARYGVDNPNWKNAGWHVCCFCGKDFHNYLKSRKFCSFDCYNKSRSKAKNKHERPKALATKRHCPYCDKEISAYNTRVKTCGSRLCRRELFIEKGSTVVTKCRNCATEFDSARSQKRIYCSYSCSVADNTPLRAGMAAAMANKYRSKKDHNHNNIVGDLEKVGFSVLDTHAIGGGFPDTICARDRANHLVEIKNPKTGYGRRGLNKLQKQFADDWNGGPVYIIRTSEDVELFANDKTRHLVEKYPTAE